MQEALQHEAIVERGRAKGKRNASNLKFVKDLL
jgi:hypothetical protein